MSLSFQFVHSLESKRRESLHEISCRTSLLNFFFLIYICFDFKSRVELSCRLGCPPSFWRGWGWVEDPVCIAAASCWWSELVLFAVYIFLSSSSSSLSKSNNYMKPTSIANYMSIFCCCVVISLTLALNNLCISNENLRVKYAEQWYAVMKLIQILTLLSFLSIGFGLFWADSQI